MTEKKTAEEVEFEQIKFEIAKIQFNKLSCGDGHIEANPATHEIALWVQSLFVQQREAYAAQQSKMPTDAEIQEAANNYNRNAPVVDESRMGFRAGVEWLRNQIEKK